MALARFRGGRYNRRAYLSVFAVEAAAPGPASQLASGHFFGDFRISRLRPRKSLVLCGLAEGRTPNTQETRVNYSDDANTFSGPGGFSVGGQGGSLPTGNEPASGCAGPS